MSRARAPHRAWHERHAKLCGTCSASSDTPSLCDLAGRSGATGPTGLTGNTGATAAAGSTGFSGAAGATGQCMPVLYFTMMDVSITLPVTLQSQADDGKQMHSYGLLIGEYEHTLTPCRVFWWYRGNWRLWQYWAHGTYRQAPVILARTFWKHAAQCITCIMRRCAMSAWCLCLQEQLAQLALQVPLEHRATQEPPVSRRKFTC